MEFFTQNHLNRTLMSNHFFSCVFSLILLFVYKYTLKAGGWFFLFYPILAKPEQKLSLNGTFNTKSSILNLNVKSFFSSVFSLMLLFVYKYPLQDRGLIFLFHPILAKPKQKMSLNGIFITKSSIQNLNVNHIFLVSYPSHCFLHTNTP